jgi:hypothetical protein
VYLFGAVGKICADDVVGKALWMIHDVVDPANKGLDWAGLGAGNGVTDATAPGPVLLISDMHNGRVSSLELRKRSVVWDDGVVGIEKGDVTCAKLFCATIGIFGVACVLSNSQQVVESDGGHVTASPKFVGFGGTADVDEVIDDGDGNS